MSQNNPVYPLFGPRYPLFIPVDPAKAKRKWRPWGIREPQVLSFTGGETESYLRARSQRSTANDAQHDNDSYPRIVNEFVPKETSE